MGGNNRKRFNSRYCAELSPPTMLAVAFTDLLLIILLSDHYVVSRR